MRSEYPLVLAAWGPADWSVVIQAVGVVTLAVLLALAAYIDEIEDLLRYMRESKPPADPANLKPYRRPKR